MAATGTGALPLLDFDDDTILLILERLDPRQLGKFCCVSQACRRLGYTQDLWRDFCLLPIREADLAAYNGSLRLYYIASYEYRIWAWGNRSFGKLGVHSGSNAIQWEPVVVQGLVGLPIVSAAAGSGHTVVLTAGGTAFAFGFGRYGQLGLGNRSDSSVPRRVEVDVPCSPKIVKVACGESFTLFLTEHGRLFGCGAGDHGQMGLGTSVSSQLQPTPLSLSSQAATSLDDPLDSSSGAGGNVMGAGGVMGDSEAKEIDANGSPPRVRTQTVNGILSPLRKPTITVADIACGAAHALAVTSAGVLFSWGCGRSGKLGHGTTTNVNQPAVVETLSSLVIKTISCGRDHSAAVSEDGILYTWGSGSIGQLGHVELKPELRPRAVDGLERVDSVKLGDAHSLTLSNGIVSTCGYGGDGALGHGDVEDCRSFRQVDALMSLDIAEIQCGMAYCIAMERPMLGSTTSRIWIWGSDRDGQLGTPQGSTESRRQPKLTPSLLQPAKTRMHRFAACGWSHALTLSVSLGPHDPPLL